MTDLEDIDVSNVPLPNQMPQVLDLSQLPSHILRSSAVEALVSQNEDLMARLGVALRRSAQLEEKISELEMLQEKIGREISINRDQMLIMQEKDRILTLKSNQHQSVVDDQNREIELLKTQYSELFLTSKEKIRQLEATQASNQRRIHLLQRHRRKLVNFNRQKIDEFAQTLRHLAGEQSMTRELRTRLGEAAVRLQEISKESDKTQKALTNAYESQISELNLRLQNLTAKSENLVSKCADYDLIYEQRIDFENNFVAEKRAFTEYRQRSETHAAQLEANLEAVKHELKIKTLESQRLTEGLNKESQLLAKQSTQLAQLSDQLESLQILWQEAQVNNEKLQTKNESLKKLNQQLSQTVNKQRREVIELKRSIENTQLKELSGQFNQLSEKKIDFDDGSWKRIETLMVEIQSGFKSQTSSTEISSTPAGGESLGSGTISER